jgi:phosphoribosylformimino-5-aminoimidazole carboxamide ribotide isomerase
MSPTTEIIIKEVPLADVWALRHEVMYPAETVAFVKLEADAAGLHWGLYKEGVLVSVISVFVEEGSLQFRKFATLTAQQGKGYGSGLLQYVMDWAVEHRIKSIWCNARTTATAMYRRFGMYAVGEPWYKYGLEFIKMEKQLL